MRYIILIIGIIYICTFELFYMIIGGVLVFLSVRNIINKKKIIKSVDASEQIDKSKLEKTRTVHINKKNNSCSEINVLNEYSDKIIEILEDDNDKYKILEELNKYRDYLNCLDDYTFRDDMIDDINKIIRDFDNFYYNYKHSVIAPKILYNYEMNLNVPVVNSDGHDEDPLYNDIVQFVIENQIVSASLLQRKFKLGYNRAARIVDLLEERGIIGPQMGSKPREVLVQLENEVNIDG